jgi:hypothetical protein
MAKNITNNEDTSDWLMKCMACAHSYTTKDDDLEVKCRCCKTGCNFKPIKGGSTNKK